MSAQRPKQLVDALEAMADRGYDVAVVIGSKLVGDPHDDEFEVEYMSSGVRRSDRGRWAEMESEEIGTFVQTAFIGRNRRFGSEEDLGEEPSDDSVREGWVARVAAEVRETAPEVMVFAVGHQEGEAIPNAEGRTVPLHVFVQGSSALEGRWRALDDDELAQLLRSFADDLALGFGQSG